MRVGDSIVIIQTYQKRSEKEVIIVVDSSIITPEPYRFCP
jgi:hypothetical protein